MARKRRRYSRNYYKTRYPAKTLVLGSYVRTSSQPRYKSKPSNLRNLSRLKKLRFVQAQNKRRLSLVKNRVTHSYKKMPLISEPMRKKTICEKRSIRKQVLHAIKKTGKTGQKKPIRKYPNVICRRT
jgi:hypothetical protein